MRDEPKATTVRKMLQLQDREFKTTKERSEVCVKTKYSNNGKSMGTGNIQIGQ